MNEATAEPCEKTINGLPICFFCLLIEKPDFLIAHWFDVILLAVDAFLRTVPALIGTAVILFNFTFMTANYNFVTISIMTINVIRGRFTTEMAFGNMF